MDPINLFVGINLIITFTAQISAAKQQLKTTLTNSEIKPVGFLQKTPLNVAAIILLLVVLGIFSLLTFNPEEYIALDTSRLIGLFFFILFSWLQIRAQKNLGVNYSQEIVILKKHELVKSGVHKFIRHPQYLFQIFSDLGAGVALLSYLIIPIVILIEIPLLVLRAREEEKLLSDHFKEEFVEYKKQSGFIIPFIG